MIEFDSSYYLHIVLDMTILIHNIINSSKNNIRPSASSVKQLFVEMAGRMWTVASSWKYVSHKSLEADRIAHLFERNIRFYKMQHV